jgi:DNA replication protein DnaD
MVSKIKDGTYINIQSFMVKHLKLKGNELLVYALIFGFSQDGESKFSGSLQYIADWTNTTKRNVINILNSLVEKELLYKSEKFINGVKFVEYAPNFTTIEKISSPSEINSMGGSEKISPNNININNINNNIEIKEKDKKEKKEFVYFENETLNNIFLEFLELRKKIKAVNSDRAIKTLIKKLDHYEDDIKYKMIENSIINSWKDVYEIKGYKKNEYKDIADRFTVKEVQSDEPFTYEKPTNVMF